MHRACKHQIARYRVVVRICTCSRPRRTEVIKRRIVHDCIVDGKFRAYRVDLTRILTRLCRLYANFFCAASAGSGISAITSIQRTANGKAVSEVSCISVNGTRILIAQYTDTSWTANTNTGDKQATNLFRYVPPCLSIMMALIRWNSADSMTKDLSPQHEKPLWPLSSYAPAKYEPLLIAGLDESFEELRVRAVTALQKNAVDEYVRYDLI